MASEENDYLTGEERGRAMKQVQDTKKIIHMNKKARAEANQRLVQVFGIDNIFTKSVDKCRFREQAVKKMNAAVRCNQRTEEHGWENLRRSAMAYFYEFLEKSDDTIHLVELTQFITLKLSLKYLFPEAEPLWDGYGSLKHIVFIGKRINELWLLSKQPDNAIVWENEHKLHQSLRAVISGDEPRLRWWDWLGGIFGFWEMRQTQEQQPNELKHDPLTPRLNPMSWILPAYETMWRVVMRCVLEIKYREANDGPKWDRILQQWLCSQKQTPFTRPCYDGIAPIDCIRQVPIYIGSLMAKPQKRI
jgi:hypothetical protein